MRILILYYSYDGNTQLIAEAIAGAIGADLERLVPVEQKHPKGLMKYVWHGRSAVMQEKPVLAPRERDILSYDIIFLGTPVWAGRWAPAFNTLFEETDFTGKKIACFYCHAGAPGSIEKRFKRQLAGASILGFQGFLDPLWSKTRDQQIARAVSWAKEILSLVPVDQR